MPSRVIGLERWSPLGVWIVPQALYGAIVLIVFILAAIGFVLGLLIPSLRASATPTESTPREAEGAVTH